MIGTEKRIKTSKDEEEEKTVPEEEETSVEIV